MTPTYLQGSMLSFVGESYLGEESFLGMGKKAKAKRQEKQAFKKEKRAIKLENKRSKVESKKTDNQVKAAQASMITALQAEPAPASVVPVVSTKSHMPTMIIAAIAFLLIAFGVFMIVKK
ncbi:hypothetical protein Q0590_25160 [Rhodocytophaga aerolata]|uniref:LPXTG cell wall anchor domain-containing protein n=1 Tax=Rhodocytophaga aerolata TaxID=455078 RepID=A0ABT8RD14_9BACT|nr:hypothetical protein [Rhodocytophaga aerolata]MDO1449591.1 hypothetical protein [Rhodocytophaga aerolata]